MYCGVDLLAGIPDQVVWRGIREKDIEFDANVFTIYGNTPRWIYL